MKNREVSYTVQWEQSQGVYSSGTLVYPSKTSALQNAIMLRIPHVRIVKTTVTREVVWKSKTLKKKRKAT